MQLIREPFIVGNTYHTVGGDLVKLVRVSNEGTSYETMACEKGVHRYTRRDFGRVTATDHKKPDHRNLVVLYRFDVEHFDVPHRWEHEIERDNKENAAKRLDGMIAMIEQDQEMGINSPKFIKDEVKKIKKEIPGWKQHLDERIKRRETAK